MLWNDFKVKGSHDLVFEETHFQDPLFIMYSSGTTGKPKCIVHGVGGTLLQHIKELGLHSDLTRSKNILSQIDEIKIVEFDHTDVVRHPLVSKIIKAYQKKIDDQI